MPKIATIKNFANMADSGLYFVENMAEMKVQGKSRLVPKYTNVYVGSETEATGFEFAQAFINRYVGGNFDTFSISDTGKIFRTDISTFTNTKLVHTLTKTLSLFPDLYLTSDNNILIPNAGFLGIAYTGQMTSDSSTTKIVDAQGRNWTTLGISASAGYNKVYNITTGTEYTVTSISTTTATNDTLNFSAGTANNENDYFIVFAEGGKDNSGSKWNFFSTITLPDFISTTQFVKRQIKQFDTDYLILNGNSIAALNTDEATWNDNFKTLPAQTEALCFEINQDRILIGCNYRGKGRLLLWDGFSDGFLSIVETEKPITSIIASDTGFIFTMANGIYNTNGYSYKLIDTLPDTVYSTTIVANFNQIKLIDGSVMLLTGGNTFGRAKAGLYSYEFGKGWVNIPLFNTATKTSNDELTLGCITSVNNLEQAGDTYTTLTSFQAAKGTNNNIVNRLTLGTANKYSTIMEFDFQDAINLKEIRFNVAPNYRSSQSSTTSATMTLNITDGRKILRRQGNTKTGSTATSILNDQGSSASNRGSVGNEVVWLSGETGGERSYITVITDGGTANEAWTISPALSTTPTTNSDIEILDFKLVGTKTLDINNLPDRVMFDTRGIYSDKLIIEVVFNSTGNGLDILAIDLYV